MRDPGGKRDTIKAEAMRLCVAHGLDAVSVRDIAAACAMKPSNLYAHFASRDSLLRELFHEGFAAYGDLLAAIASAPDPFHTRLERMVRTMCRLHDEDTVRFRFLLLTQHGGLRDVDTDARNPVEILCRVISAAMAAGDIRHGEPNLLAMALIGLIIQPATALLYGRLSGGLAERADTLCALCRRVLS